MGKSVVQTTIQLLGKLDPSVKKAMSQTESMASKTGQAIGKALMAGLSSISVGAIVKQFADIGIAYQSATGQIAAATGATGAELENLQGVMESVYGNNYGENMQEVADAVATVNQQMKGLSGDELQGVTEGAFALRDVFQYDVAESVRAAEALTKNFGVSGQEAMNLIAAGSQNGLNFSGELLDTISEYSVQFAKVGIDADQMFQIMQAGADSGAWNLDKVGDAIKEMSIRVVDGSDTTIAAFKTLNMDADAMAQSFAAGGESAQKAFRDTVAALASMEDPVQQNSVGVKLFGTMWEDLGPEVVSQLASITDEAYAAGDELAKMSEVKYDNLGDALKGAGRKIETALMPIANKMTSFLTDILGKIDFEGLTEGIENAFSGIVNFLGPIIQPLQEMFSSIFSSDLASPAQALMSLQDPMQSIAQFLSPIIEGFSNLVAQTLPLVIEMVQLVADAFFNVLSALTPVLAPLQKMAQSIFPILSTVIQEAAAIFLNLGQQVFPVFSSVAQTVANVVSRILSMVSTLIPPLQQLAQAIFPVLSAVVQQVGTVFVNMVNFAMPIIQGFIEFLMPAFQGILTILQNVIDFVTNIFTANWSAAWQNVTNIFGTIWGGIVGLVKAPINAVIGIINSAIGAINSISVTVPDWVPVLGGQTFGFSIPQIPMLATGGTILEPMLAVVGDAPETIVPHGNTPRNRALLGEAAAGVGASIGGTVVNFNVTISGGSADEVRQGILDAEEEFERRMDAYFAKKARVSFA